VALFPEKREFGMNASRGTMESLQTGCITVCYKNRSAHRRKSRQRAITMDKMNISFLPSGGAWVRGSISIHFLVRLSRAGSRWQLAKQGPPGFLLPSHALQFLLGDPEAFPGQKRYVIPPADSGSARGLLPVGRARKTSKGRRPGGILIRCPNHLS